MNILLTNDDGIYSPALAALYRELQRLGNVTVVAPQTEQSGVGLSITYLHPLMARRVTPQEGLTGWAVGGSPADCVKLGVLEFCPGRPDLIVSGMNTGANVGINVLYSGTVAGAIEGAFGGITSIAVSHVTDTAPDYAAASRRCVTVIEQLLATRPPVGSLWNINHPAAKPGWPRGVKSAKMSTRRTREVLEKRVDPRGRDYFWSGVDPIEHHEAAPGSDVRELYDGYITITPLHFNLTEPQLLGVLDAIDWQV